MNPTWRLLLFVSLTLVWSGMAGAQQREEEEAGESAAGQSRSQEVEVSEDNYRRFMELKDRPMERAPLPVEAYDPQAELEKMGKLPEASQKHLRNQLREIISQGEAWQPGDEGKEYAYVPSSAAENDAALRRQEGEAWTELVGKYHEREAAILAGARQAANASNGTAGQDAMQQGKQAPANPSAPVGAAGMQGAGQDAMQQGQQAPADPSAPDGAAGVAGAAQEGEGDSGQAARERARAQALEAALSMPDAASTPKASVRAVPERSRTENALEYLEENGQPVAMPSANKDFAPPRAGEPVCPERDEDGEASRSCEDESAEREPKH